MKEKFAEMNSESESKKREIKSRIKDINDKLEKLEEKYVFNDLNPNIYKKHLKKLMDEKNELKKESEQSKIKLSNLE